jgi:hypothetical protein
MNYVEESIESNLEMTRLDLIDGLGLIVFEFVLSFRY